MAADTATFQINLENGVSGPAESASRALEGLRSSIDKDTRALAALQKAQKNLQKGSVVNVQQFKALQAQINSTKERIAQAQSSVIDLGGVLGAGKKPASGFAAALAKMQQQAQGVGGPLGGVAGGLGKLKSLLTGGGAVSLGLVAVAAALALLSVAAIAATGALLKYGIAQADARRSELLRLEGLTKIRSVWGIAAGNAKEMQSAIDRVSGSTALSRAEIGKYATQLYKAGLRGENLSQALEATAMKASVQGDAYAEAFAGTAASIALAGGSVKKFADNVKARLGGVAAKHMLSLNVISTKLRENFALLFSGLNIEGFLAGLKSVTDLFSQSTVSGRALKAIVGAVFQPMIGALEYLAPMAKDFFRGMVIGALDITIAIARAALWVKKTFGIEFKKNVGEAQTALTMGKVAVYAFVGALGAVAAAGAFLAVALLPVLWGAVTAVWGLVAAGAAAAAPFLGLAAIFVGVAAATYYLVKYLRKVDWAALGTSICDGIVNGLKSGAKWVLDSVKWLADKTMGAFKSALGIHSPSREFANLGVQLPRGVEQGIEQGQPSLDRSVDQMVKPPTAGDSQGTGVAARAGAAKPSITIGEITIQTNATDAKEIAHDLRAALEDILSGVSLQIGAPA